MTGPAQPALRIVRGRPTPSEVAVVVAVLAARSHATPAVAVPPAPVGRWNDPRAGLRGAHAVGPGAWARSGAAPGTRTRATW